MTSRGSRVSRSRRSRGCSTAAATRARRPRNACSRRWPSSGSSPTARRVPMGTLANGATKTTTNVHSDNHAGMRELARHLLADHGYRSLAYLAGLADSPDSLARGETIAAEAAAADATLLTGPQWQGNYYATSRATVVERLVGRRAPRP